MLDLAQNDPSVLSEAGFTFKIVLPNGVETDAELTVRGANSPVVRNHARRLYQEFKQKEQAAKRKGKEVEDLTLDEAEELAVDTAVQRLIGWKNVAEDGKELKFSKEEAARVLQKYPFIRAQVMEQSDEVSNFFR